MKIGELARATGTPVETIRYYEREGLLPEPARNAANYRVYADAHAERLAFIRHCRSLDMALDEIRTLLRFRDAPPDDCTPIDALLDAHIGHVAERIRALKALQGQLKALRARCPRPHRASCGILDELAQSADGAAPAGPAATAHVPGTHGRRPVSAVSRRSRNPAAPIRSE